MADSNYTKLLEPGQIGKVKTRNRIYKTAAGMMVFHDDEPSRTPSPSGSTKPWPRAAWEFCR